MKFLKADKELAQVAWNFVNDSLRTTICLQYPPATVALACIYLAAKYRHSILGDGKKWWAEHSVTLDQLHDIALQILDLYESSTEMEALRKGMESDKALENGTHHPLHPISASTPSSTSSMVSAEPQISPNINPSSPAQSHTSPRDEFSSSRSNNNYNNNSSSSSNSGGNSSGGSHRAARPNSPPHRRSLSPPASRLSSQIITTASPPAQRN